MSQRPEIAHVKGEEPRQISRWEHVAKLAVSTYLQTCLTGARKDFFKTFAPYASQWQLRTDHAWQGTNPLDQAVQIARFFELVKENPPQILIRTTGYTARSSNLGSFAVGHSVPAANQAANAFAPEQVVASIESTSVPIDLAVAALDEDQAHYLVHFLEQALGPMCRFLINYLLLPEEESHRNWAVTLPMTWNVGGLTDVNIGDDRKQRLWTTTYTAEVNVEVATWAKYRTPLTLAVASLRPESGGVSATIPSTVRVGSVTPLYVDRRPVGSRWKVTDLQRARITEHDALYAKRVGDVVVSLVSEMKPTDAPYATATVTILP